jgi:hypothetical protein
MVTFAKGFVVRNAGYWESEASVPAIPFLEVEVVEVYDLV